MVHSANTTVMTSAAALIMSPSGDSWRASPTAATNAVIAAQPRSTALDRRNRTPTGCGFFGWPVAGVAGMTLSTTARTAFSTCFAVIGGMSFAGAAGGSSTISLVGGLLFGVGSARSSVCRCSTSVRIGAGSHVSSRCGTSITDSSLAGVGRCAGSRTRHGTISGTSAGGTCDRSGSWCTTR